MKHYDIFLISGIPLETRQHLDQLLINNFYYLATSNHWNNTNIVHVGILLISTAPVIDKNENNIYSQDHFVLFVFCMHLIKLPSEVTLKLKIQTTSAHLIFFSIKIYDFKQRNFFRFSISFFCPDSYRSSFSFAETF